jgi:2-polyprenyl-3-methyl-5-hydroxy-6-metoxy-1,4-benzoquinol methylase
MLTPFTLRHPFVSSDAAFRGCPTMAHLALTGARVADSSIRFDDGASYEQMMGRWSRLVGERFLDWIEVPDGARWIDVGCGNGALTELLLHRSSARAKAVTGIKRRWGLARSSEMATPRSRNIP